jgi:hypothetical protein
MEEFDEILDKMSKPQISGLKHQEMLSDAVIKARERSVLSWWWISIPVYLIAALLMKTVFMPGTSFYSNLHAMASGNRFLSILLFLVIPAIIIVVNLFHIRKIYSLTGNPGSATFFRIAWFNLLAVAASAVIILIYLF